MGHVQISLSTWLKPALPRALLGSPFRLSDNDVLRADVILHGNPSSHLHVIRKVMGICPTQTSRNLHMETLSFLSEAQEETINGGRSRFSGNTIYVFSSGSGNTAGDNTTQVVAGNGGLVGINWKSFT